MLLHLAKAAIRQALDSPPADRAASLLWGVDSLPAREQIPPELAVPRASFVTLTLDGALRGCMGRLEARCALVEDVAENARAAALDDPRFAPLSPAELERVAIHISVLSNLEALRFSSEAELLDQLRPGVDGVVLEAVGRRATFLPCVWDELPDRALFWRRLKAKAGLSPDYWSATLRAFRYTAEFFPADG